MEKSTQPLQGWCNHKDRLWHWVSRALKLSLVAGLKSWWMPGALIWWFCQCWALEIIDTQGDEALKTTKNNLLKSCKPIYAALCLDVSNCHANFNDLSSMRLAAIVFELGSFYWGNKLLHFHNPQNYFLGLPCRNFARFKDWSTHSRKSAACLAGCLCRGRSWQRL